MLYAVVSRRAQLPNAPHNKIGEGSFAMSKETMGKTEFFEKLSEKLSAMREAGFDVNMEQGENPWTVSVSIGKEGAEPHIIDVSLYSHVASGYEQGFDVEIFSGVLNWNWLIDEAHAGRFDEELFCDAATFAFEKLIEGANEKHVSRHDAYLALKINEFAALGAEGSEKFAAAQLVAEALSVQACGGWQRIDEEVLADKLVVFKVGNKVLVDMNPCDLTPLLD